MASQFYNIELPPAVTNLRHVPQTIWYVRISTHSSACTSSGMSVEGGGRRIEPMNVLCRGAMFARREGRERGLALIPRTAILESASTCPLSSSKWLSPSHLPLPHPIQIFFPITLPTFIQKIPASFNVSDIADRASFEILFCCHELACFPLLS
ncbi:hypothetical protein TNCT_661821 [Trichonephila clavata]|uniref:Uncharacterized protein n=1 Tax=Trichonephila clavata TaxID=2740835 RepID=A0A8X6IGG1_TRICU|nr:hypothetical protein TNCT_661821 [Trichonephila clavata]